MAPKQKRPPAVARGVVNSNVIDALYNREQAFLSSLGYKPSYMWALRVIEGLSFIILIVVGALFLGSSERKSRGEEKKARRVTLNFRIFQAQYLSVYLVVMLADWLQGTNMYTLYSSYGVDVGTLFLTGFLSSAVFGTFLGVYVDKWGRRLGCIIFCVLEIVINVLEHVPSMPVLLLGRVLGGISTSLLFSAFESWMVTEHRRRGFHEDLLSSTFSISSWGSAVMAIFAGFLAQKSADLFGDIGPFQLAILLTVVALVLIVLWWGENYGDDDEELSMGGSAPNPPGSSSILGSLQQSFRLIWATPSILYLGLSQSFFEGAMYTFVFMWVPSLQAVFKSLQEQGSTDELPIGLVFSSFMLAMAIGGLLFGAVLPWFPGGANGLCIFTYVLAALVMMLPAINFTFTSVIASFLVFEATVGMFNSCGAQLRSELYPGAMQSSIMSVFRLPLNVLVVLGTNAANYASDVPTMQGMFGLIAVMMLVASHLQVALTAVRGMGPAALAVEGGAGDGSDTKLRRNGQTPPAVIGAGGPNIKPLSTGASATAISDHFGGMLARKEKEIVNAIRLQISELAKLEQLAQKDAQAQSQAQAQAQAQAHAQAQARAQAAEPGATATAALAGPAAN